ncbi:hypothetical protein C2G38_2204872 [Gigaspora rosea]|uniref:Uncharacterized protein n=1 Tax=Gigaspora rosea TaxID=44941 RepID=A0A397UKY3_9GLOM|nr:hypothetical protein C2G38_2204872 [Gigaspora rosea]
MAQKIQLGQLKLKTFMRGLAKKTGINCKDYNLPIKQDGVQKSALANLINTIDFNTNTKILQNQSPVTFSTKDSYQGLNLKSCFEYVFYFNNPRSITEASTQLANSHELQGSKISLQELLPIPNQNNKIQEFLQRNLFINSNITFYIYNHYYTILQQ